MSGYWVYILTTPNKMVYVGMSKAKYTCKRCRKDLYRSTSLQSYIDEFGFDSFSKFFIDGLESKKEAVRLENELIEMYSEKGCCINKNSSHLLSSDKEHKREYDKERYEKQKKMKKQSA